MELGATGLQRAGEISVIWNGNLACRSAFSREIRLKQAIPRRPAGRGSQG